MPSKDELNLLYNQKNVVGCFEDTYYWSSSEYDESDAWVQNIGTGVQNWGGKTIPTNVRAIRAF